MIESRQFQEETAEYRAMVATAGALVCCAIGLIVATLVLVTGDRFEFKPASPGDNLVRSFEALESMARRPAAATNPLEIMQRPPISGAAEPPKRRIVTRLKSPWCTGVLAHQPFHSCTPRPK